jgi:amidase
MLEDVDRFRSEMLEFMQRYDVILCPVCAFPAPPHGTTFTEDMWKGFSYTGSYNLTGWPGAVVRAGTSPEGLPIGVQIVARPWREDVALAVAQHLETALGGWQPPAL